MSAFDDSQTVLFIEKPKHDSKGKRLTKVNISQYTNVDRKTVLSLKVLLFNCLVFLFLINSQNIFT